MKSSVQKFDVACLVFYCAEGRFLATRRPPEKALGNLWEFPGGKVEPHEHPEEALRRELLEELRLEVGALVPLASTTHVYKFATIRLLPFLSRCDTPPVLDLQEHTEHRWVTLAEAEALEWAPADLPILAGLRFHDL